MISFLRHISRHKIILIIVTAYLILFTSIKFNQHLSFQTDGDTSIFVQALWNTLHGNFFYSTFDNISLLRVHSAYILFLILPIYALIPSPLTLMFIQVFIVSLSAILLYFLCLDLFKSQKISIMVTFAYMFSPFLIKAILYEFHFELFFPLLIFYIFIAYRKKA